jgi:hypothetical protein
LGPCNLALRHISVWHPPVKRSWLLCRRLCAPRLHHI